MELGRILEERLALFRTNFWRGERWVLLQPGSGSKDVWFFNDYLEAERYAVGLPESWKVLTLTRAIKLLMHAAYDKVEMSTLRGFLAALNVYPLSIGISEEIVAHLLSMNEYVPVVWGRLYYPLSCCKKFRVLNDTKSILHEATEFSKGFIEFENCRKKMLKAVELIGVLDAGHLGLDGNVPNICFYRGGEGGTVVQVQDPTEAVMHETMCFVKYEFKKGRVLFFAPALRRCRPGDLFGESSRSRFLARAITRYELLPVKMF